MTFEPGRGAIVLAAYSPSPELFRVQLMSLQNQTVQDWECIISVDGETEPVAQLVKETVGDDDRFRVIGDGSRRGFYLNFEHGLQLVAQDTAWVALADQDDCWDADKIERLLPHLLEVSLVSGQARLISHPDGTQTGLTARQDYGAVFTMLSNQFTGSLCIFTPDVLSTALPFPRASTRVATHDHWLAVVASAHRGTRITADVVQDYVQHDANVFGDPSRLNRGSIVRSVRNVLDQARRYEGSRSPLAVARMTFWTYVGWRQLMTDALSSRHRLPDERWMTAFGSKRQFRAAFSLLRVAQSHGVIPRRFALEYRVSWFCGIVSGGRAAVSRAAARPHVQT